MIGKRLESTFSIVENCLGLREAKREQMKFKVHQEYSHSNRCFN